jgi:hypothetical protein
MKSSLKILESREFEDISHLNDKIAIGFEFSKEKIKSRLSFTYFFVVVTFVLIIFL